MEFERRLARYYAIEARSQCPQSTDYESPFQDANDACRRTHPRRKVPLALTTYRNTVLWRNKAQDSLNRMESGLFAQRPNQDIITTPLKYVSPQVVIAHRRN
jgi:hypothetical protein